MHGIANDNFHQNTELVKQDGENGSSLGHFDLEIVLFKMPAIYVADETRLIGLVIKVKAIDQASARPSIQGYKEIKATDVFYINYNTQFRISASDAPQTEPQQNQVGKCVLSSNLAKLQFSL